MRTTALTSVELARFVSHGYLRLDAVVPDEMNREALELLPNGIADVPYGTPVTDVPVDVWQRWQSDLSYAPPGGESIAALGHRVRTACDEWASRLDEPGTIVLVTHVSPIKAAAAWALGVGDEVCWRTHLDTASISRALVRGGRPVLDLFNETSHLR